MRLKKKLLAKVKDERKTLHSSACQTFVNGELYYVRTWEAKYISFKEGTFSFELSVNVPFFSKGAVFLLTHFKLWLSNHCNDCVLTIRDPEASR